MVWCVHNNIYCIVSVNLYNATCVLPSASGLSNNTMSYAMWLELECRFEDIAKFHDSATAGPSIMIHKLWPLNLDFLSRCCFLGSTLLVPEQLMLAMKHAEERKGWKWEKKDVNLWRHTETGVMERNNQKKIHADKHMEHVDFEKARKENGKICIM